MQRVVPWLALIARLVVGGVWIAAGALKLPDPAESVRAVRAYELLPEAIVPTVGYLLPVVEVVVGVCLIVGLMVRPMAVVSSVLFVAFIIGIAAAWVRGLEIDCGCFGGGGVEEGASSKYPWEIARDVGLLAASLLLVWRPRTPWSVDRFLFAADAGEGFDPDFDSDFDQDPSDDLQPDVNLEGRV
ncbi:MAG: DoxX family membrane protein [Nocardioidaceae bacterium]|nr:MAG: DoxX family membrane protein [Nocardioidaceae bacterium]